jgi:hypothetical protein
MSAEQLALIVGVVIALPLIGWLAWWGIKHWSGGNT